MRIGRWLMVALLCALVPVAWAAGVRPQRKSGTVSRQKQRTEQELRDANRRLRDNQASLERRLDDLQLLESKVENKGRECRAMRIAVDSLDRSIRLKTDSVHKLDADLASIRSRYASAVRNTRIHRTDENTLAFVFSAGSFGEGYRRYRYMKEFSRWRERKTTEIGTMMGRLDTERRQLSVTRRERAGTLERLRRQEKLLAHQQDSVSAMVVSLRREGRGLRELVRRKSEEARRLDEELARLIAAEQEAAEREERERAAREQAERDRQQKETKVDTGGKVRTEPAPVKKPVEPTAPVKPAPTTPASGFADNKGKLPRPVSGQWNVVSKFGRHKHPQLQYVEVNNAGIDVETNPGAKALAVFDGKVSAIFQQPGYDNIVMVRHGQYLTIYANIKSLAVKTGDVVTQGQPVGVIAGKADDKNRTILHFEIRKEKEKLDPELWLRR